MRIISGKHRGKVLSTFKGEEIRPTSDRAKSAIFNILQFKIKDSVFLDAFSGSGSMGIEAISRGAKTVVLLDKSKKSIELINKNLKSINESCIVENIDALEYLMRTSLKFDYVFLDPPYDSNSGEIALKIISNRDLLNRGGLAIYEHKNADNRLIEGLKLVDSRKYGKSNIDFYEAEK